MLGCVDHVHDLIHDGRSVVLLGSPGVGMTTVLREIARVLSDAKGRRVVVIDTYNQVMNVTQTKLMKNIFRNNLDFFLIHPYLQK